MFRTKCKEHDHSSFYKFLQMEHDHKNTDCYFFYYSTCKKGDFCPFRHEPSALGCETMCTYWQQGNCLNEHCNFRHMELKKNRKSIPCYWETQPGGCRKPHCSFLHKNARTIAGNPINPVKTTEVTTKSSNQEWLGRQDDTKYDGSSTESDQGRGSSEAGSFIGSPAVDPLIVKFEEDSDDDSVQSSKLSPNDSRKGSWCSTKGKVAFTDTKKSEEKLNFEILSLEEIRRRKREKEHAIAGSSKSLSETTESEECQNTVLAPKKRKSDEHILGSSVKPVKLRRQNYTATSVPSERKELHRNMIDRSVETSRREDPIVYIVQPQIQKQREPNAPQISVEKTEIIACDSTTEKQVPYNLSVPTEMDTPNDVSVPSKTQIPSNISTLNTTSAIQDLFLDDEDLNKEDCSVHDDSINVIEEIDSLLQE